MLKGLEKQFQKLLEQKSPVNDKLIEVIAKAGSHMSFNHRYLFFFLEYMLNVSNSFMCLSQISKHFEDIWHISRGLKHIKLFRVSTLFNKAKNVQSENSQKGREAI